MIINPYKIRYDRRSKAGSWAGTRAGAWSWAGVWAGQDNEDQSRAGRQ